MHEKVQAKLERFVENRDIIRKASVFVEETMVIATALVFTDAGVTPNIDKIKECRQILKGKAGALSNYRGTIELIVTSKMSLQENPEKYIDDVMALEKKLKSSKVFDYSTEIMAAMLVVDAGRLDEADAIVEKYDAIMKLMKKEHPLLTDQNDMPFAMMLALSEKDTETVIKEMEECYDFMRKNFKAGKNSTQGISEVLTLYDTDVASKCSRAIEIYHVLEERGQKYGKEYEFASLGVLCNVDVDAKALADEIAEAAEFLFEKKGFGNWTIGPDARRMFAAMIVAGVYGEEGKNISNSAVADTIAVVVAEEVALLMIIIWSNTMLFI